jgi:two-component system C4-dicarboxylate transport response regulator DctD
MTRRVLIVDDEKAVREALGQTLELAELEPVLAGSYIEAKDRVGPDFPGVVLSDVRMPGKDGFDLLALCRARDPDLPVILLTGEADIPMAVQGISDGAFAFLEKPCGPADLVDVVKKALKTRQLVLENRRLKTRLMAGDAAARVIVGESEAARGLRRRVRAVAATRAEVLVTGEPGTGTAKIAEVIHQLADPAGPLIRLGAGGADAPALAAAAARAGAGTLFVEEAGALDQAAQLALLELVDAHPALRVIASTSRDLAAEAAAGRFNQDLFYKLDVMRVRIPPLRERTEDIAAMFRNFVAVACEQAALPEPEIGPDLLSRLVAQDWPGNARALQNAAMRFALGVATPEEEAEAGPADTEDLGLTERMRRIERSLILDALRRHAGNATETARALRLPRKTFYDKLARHGIRAEDFRRP